ncbi:hypothetical protein BGZ94_000250 [Podila epigama]|nr:hypothetical protein BGZ94_000250 [Podila epigama]
MVKVKKEHKNLGWEIIKLEAKVGESTSKKAKKVVAAAEKKKSAESAGTSTGQVDEVAAAQLLKLKEIKISQKIYHAKKEIKRNFVKSKSMEIQRLNKRIKEAKKAVESGSNAGKDEKKEEEEKASANKKKSLTSEDIQKFEHELSIVKDMDMDQLSEQAFMTKLAKHPFLGSHALMAPYVESKKQDSTKTAEATSSTTQKPSQEPIDQILGARLTNAKPVRECMLKLWDELEHIITGRSRKAELEKKRKADNGQEDSKQDTKKTKTNDTKKNSENENSKRGSKHDDADDDDDEDEDSDAMSDISFGEEDDGYDSDGLPLPMNGRSTTGFSSMFVGSLNEGSKKDKNKKKDKNDWVDPNFDEIYGKVKKNRPGQRARREKAERKYGKEANHVKKAAEEAKIREERKAARKAKKEKFNAKEASSANAQRLPNKRVIGAGDGSAATRAPPPAKPASAPEPVDPSLHPSWLAKKSEKAAVAAALSGAKSNKIVFDDSD